MDRRDFIKVVVAGAVTPGVVGFKEKVVEPLLPYLIPPEDIIPGVANWYASACRQCSAGCGILVRIREGRAKKIEGNPLCPVNEGRLCARGQAGLQVLYNPDRIKQPLIRESGRFKEASWNEGLKLLVAKLRELKTKGSSDRVVFLSQPIRGHLAALIDRFMKSYGSTNFFSYELFDNGPLIAANELSFGYGAIPHYDIANAKYVVSFGAGFLDSWVSPVHYSVAYGKFRDRPVESRGHLVQFEPRLSLTGASADEWIPSKPGSESAIALGMAKLIADEKLYDPALEPEIQAWKAALGEHSIERAARESGVPAEKIAEVARRFAKSRPSLALSGDPAHLNGDGLHGAVAANVLNHLVGSIGGDGGVKFGRPPIFPDAIEKRIGGHELASLIEKMKAGEVQALLVYGANPAFTVGSEFIAALKKVPFIASFSSFMDETTGMADLVLPDNTYLESWGDCIPIVDGGKSSAVMMQPVVSRVYDTRQIGDVILSLAKSLGGDISRSHPWNNFFDFLKSSWREFHRSAIERGSDVPPDFEDFWKNLVLTGGWFEKDASFDENQPIKRPKPEIVSSGGFEKPKATGEEFALHLYPSHGLYDGRHANLPWLQQMPEPLVTATWGSWAEINPETAREMGISEGDVLEISSEKGSIEVPAYIFPAIEPKTIAVPIGQGHTSYGSYAAGRGVNPLKLVDSARFELADVKVSKTGKKEKVIKLEPDVPQPGIEGGVNEVDREIVQWITPDEAAALERKELDPIKALPSRDLKKPSIIWALLGLGKYRTSRTEKRKMDYRWGMVIDLDKCTGCQACMVACYSENNLPLVSDVEMARRRHKNWIRLDRYWEGEYPEVRAKLMPVNCQQCGNAPCEAVCPVYAAYGAFDGLNGQVYQRCIGTRYCNVNCPYRARLFNWFNPEWPKPLDEQLNPDVSVRTSGIVDKCTFCVQRIREAKERASDESRKVRDGEIKPACAQTCPTGAIAFGDLKDLTTEVSKLSRSPRRFRLLEELNTEPAVIYLKAVREHVESKRA